MHLTNAYFRVKIASVSSSKMANISISQIQARNSWWQRPELVLDDPYLSKLREADYIYRHPLLTDFPVDRDAVLTLRGPRRIGKTTLLMQIIRWLLLEKGVRPQNVMFFPGDTVSDFRELKSLLETYLEFIRPRSSKRIYIFLDEISFIKDWPRAVKELADRGAFQNATLLITGSNILDLKFSSERMPGRRGEKFPWDVEFLPLSFSEFLSLIGEKKGLDSYLAANAKLPQLRKFFLEYLLVGGFPLTINEYYKTGRLAPETYEIFLSWIEGDLHRVGKSEDTAYHIFGRLFRHLTSPVSFYKLTRESGLSSHETTQEYLDIFGKMFLTVEFPHLTIEQKKAEPRKNRKFYFMDPFIFNVIKARVDGFVHDPFGYSKEGIVTEDTLPRLVENTVAAFLSRRFFKTYVGQSSVGEVDIVGFEEGEYHYYEVKYQNKVRAHEFAKLREKLDRPLVVLTKRDYHENDVNLIPAEAFLAVSL